MDQVKVCLWNSNAVVTFLSGLSRYDNKVTIILMVEYKLCKREENKRILCFQTWFLWLREKAEFFFLSIFFKWSFLNRRGKHSANKCMNIHAAPCISVVIFVNYHLSNTALQILIAQKKIYYCFTHGRNERRYNVINHNSYHLF